MAQATARDRLVRSAFDLFDRQGYARTTVDDIAAAAGAGRSTFFRHFPSKEDVVFPDHDAILDTVEARLATASPDATTVALHEASRVVLRHYLEEGDVARARYRLTSSVPALRDAEMAGQRRYQRLFRRHLNAWLEAAGRPDDLVAEVLANAVVTAHNHVLRAWLRDESTDPESELETAIVGVVARLWRKTSTTESEHVVVVRTRRDLDDVLPELQRLVGP